MPSRYKHHASKTRNLATVVAAIAVRKALRPLVSRRAASFTALLRVPPDEVYLYQNAAGIVLQLGDHVNKNGNDPSEVFSLEVLRDAPWNISTRIGEARFVVIVAASEQKVSREISLLLDFEAVVERPTPIHFLAAARKLGLGLSDAQALELSKRALNDVQLAIRPGRPIERVIASLARYDADPHGSQDPRDAPVSDVSLETLPGYGEARAWGFQLAKDLADYSAGRIEWQDVDRGVLLSGPPGSGKTLYAKALAVTCGVPLVSGSAGRWQAKGHLGDFLKEMRSFFDEAARKAPCIAFIDEFDSFGDRGRGRGDEHHDYKRQVVNALLECLDPVDGRQGVVVVGATNDAAAVDPALLRPGRLEKTIVIELPDEATRAAILRHHLPNAEDGLDLDRLVGGLVGWTPADLAKLARDARRVSRRRGADIVTGEDLRAAMPRRRDFSAEELHRIAIHEAGHALLGCLLQPGNLVSVQISASWLEGRPTRVGGARFRKPLPLLPCRRDFEDHITILLGGMIAEQLVFGDHATGASGDEASDLASVTRLATMMERMLGYGLTLVTDPSSEFAAVNEGRRHDRDLSRSVATRLDGCAANARRLVAENMHALSTIAEALARDLVLQGSDVARMIDQSFRETHKSSSRPGSATGGTGSPVGSVERNLDDVGPSGESFGAALDRTGPPVVKVRLRPRALVEQPRLKRPLDGGRND